MTEWQAVSSNEQAHTVRRQLTILAGARMTGMSGYWAAFIASLPVALAQPHPTVWLAVFTGCWTAPAILAAAFGHLIDSAGPRVIATVSWGVAGLVCLFPVIAEQRMPVLAIALAVISLSFGVGMSAGEVAPSQLPSGPDPAILARAGTLLGIALALSVGVGALGSSLLAVIGNQTAWLLAGGLCIFGAILSAIVPTIRPSSWTAAGKTTARIPVIPPSAMVVGGTAITPTLPPVSTVKTYGSDGPSTAERAGILGVMAATLGVFVGYGLITVLMALYVTSRLHDSYDTYGWLLGIWALADALTLAAISRYIDFISEPAVLFIAAAVLAIGEGLAFSTSWLPVSALGLAVYGSGSALFYMAGRSAITNVAPVAQHARIFAIWWSIQAVGMAIPALFASALVTVVGLRTALLTAPILATLTAIVAAAAVVISQFRSQDTGEGKP